MPRVKQENELIARQDGAVILKITNGDETFIIDEDDYERVKHQSWYYHKTAKYVVANMGLGAERKTVLLHKFLKGERQGFLIDHSDRNRFNNRQANLRWATRQENNRNQNLRRDNLTGFKGVSFHAKTRKYQASITVNEIQRYTLDYSILREKLRLHTMRKQDVSFENLPS